MLAVPLKKGKSADWGVPLREYIAQAYGEKTADEQTENLAKLNQAREWVLSNSQKIDQSALDNVKVYLRMLGAVEARFPIKETHVNVTFTWYDSFKPAKKFMHHRVEDERAAVLFNYAAMESYSGMVLDRSTEQGTNAASAHFNTAARYFQFLRDVYIPEKVEGPVTSDLSKDGLTMLINLMLAQAQACAFEKAVRKKMKPPSLSKLAAGAQELYRNALVASESSNLKTIIDASWANHMRYQRDCYAASAAFYHSKAKMIEFDKTGEGFGERIAFLKMAQNICDGVLARKAKDELSSNQTDIIDGLKATVSKDLNKAVTDNNSIYLEVVPEVSTLEAPAGYILAKVKLEDVDELLVRPIVPGLEVEDDEKGGDLFKELLPAEVQMAVALFKSRVSDLVEKATKLVNSKAERIEESLQGANLPAAIEAGGGQRGLPDETWARIIEVVHQKGGVAGLKSVLLGNGRLGEQLGAALYECKQKLVIDESNDEKNRQIWGAKWSLPPPAQANSLVNKDLARYKGLLAEAKESDKHLLRKIETNPLKQTLDDVSKPKAGLDALMPDPGQVDDDFTVESLRSKLRMSFIDLKTHLSTITSKLDEYTYTTSKASIVSELFKSKDTLSDQKKVERIIDEKIDVLSEPYDEIKRLADMHEQKLSRVLNDNSAYLASRRENAATKERETELARIEHGIQQFGQLSSHIEEGKKFYASLTEKVNRLQTVVNDHCLSRDLLAKELEQNLTRGLDNNTFNNVPNNSTTVGPVSQPYSGTTYNNPQTYAPVVHQTQPRSLPSTVQTPVVAVSPAVTPVVQQTRPGESLLEQLERAQLAAEQNGTLNDFAGANVSEGAAPAPAPAPKNTPNDDASALQTAMALEQEEILNAIRTANAIKESKRSDFSQEMGKVKELLGNEFADKLIIAHLKSNRGNVPLTISNLMDGIPPKKAGKAGGRNMFGRKKKPKKKGRDGGGGAPVTDGNQFNW